MVAAAATAVAAAGRARGSELRRRLRGVGFAGHCRRDATEHTALRRLVENTLQMPAEGFAPVRRKCGEAARVRRHDQHRRRASIRLLAPALRPALARRACRGSGARLRAAPRSAAGARPDSFESPSLVRTRRAELRLVNLPRNDNPPPQGIALSRGRRGRAGRARSDRSGRPEIAAGSPRWFRGRR